MNGLTLVVLAIVLFVCAYCFYGRWLVKTWGIDPNAVTPARRFENGKDFVPASKFTVFAHQFSAICGAGPVTGPIIAAMFGWLPALLWLLIGGIFFGAVQDFTALYASVKNDGMSMGMLIEKYVGRTGGKLFLAFCWLFSLLVIAAFSDIMATTFNGFGKDGQMMAPNAAAASISMLYVFVAMIFGVILKKTKLSGWKELALAIVFIVAMIAGGIAYPVYADRVTWLYVTYGYCFLASILPMWLLIQPRDYLSVFLLLGMILAGVVGVIVGNPTLNMPAVTGFTVEYSLDRVAADGTLVAEGARAAYENIAFAVPVTSVEGHAFYRVRAHLTSGESTLVVDSANTIGVLKVQPTIARSIIAVPWKSLATGGDITVADYIRAADLSDGDKLHVYNGSSYDTWTYSGGGLIPSTTFIVGSDGVTSTEPSPAAEKTLARGTGVWLERASGTAKNLYLIGEYTPEPVETPITAGSKSAMSWNLVGAPSYEQIDLNTAIGKSVNANAADRIVVPMPNGLQRNYTYKNGKWGYSDARTIEVNGRTRVQTFHNTNAVLPAGIGFWYLNTGDTGTIKW